MIKALVCITLLLCCTLAKSQVVYDLQSPGKKLSSRTHKYLQYMEQKSGLIYFQSILTRNIQPSTLDGEKCWLITQTYQSQQAIDTDSSYCHLITLSPLSYHSDIRSEKYREQVFFTRNIIENHILFQDSAIRFNKPNANFYGAVTTEELIAAYPLTAQSYFEIKNVNPGKNYSEAVTSVKVIGREDLNIPGIGNIACWKISTSSNGASATEWYTVSGHVQVKKKFDLGGGNSFYRVLISGSDN